MSLPKKSEQTKKMPRRWREALEGKGELDLSGVRLLSDAHYLWSPGTLAGNLTSFFASKAVRSRVGQVKGDELPPALQHPKFKGKVYRLSELVLDVPENELEQVKQTLPQLMAGVAQLKVPLVADLGFGPNWEQAH